MCIEEMAPKFAERYNDLGDVVKVNKEFGQWTYLFELPTDYVDLVAQLNEGDKNTHYEHEILTFTDYAHVVKGTDDQAWYCILAHTAASADEPITGANYASYWSLYNTDEDYGADWASGYSYKASGNAHLLATNDLSNADGDSAYIKYLAYVQAGFADKPQLYTDVFKLAFATRLAAEMALDSKDYRRHLNLLEEYFRIARPEARRMNQRHRYKDAHISVLAARLK